ncbi:MAG: M28 family peptidase [Saprospiraceae bacterium]|nr:M28 family peptidase [Saprospiraceae bacterium]
MKKCCFILLTILVSVSLNAQMNMDPGLDYSKALKTDYEAYDPAPFVSTVNKEDLHKYISKLASDEFEGRETGQPGNRKAADFIRDRFVEFGIPPVPGTGSYFQTMQFNWNSWNKVEMVADGEEYRHGWDFLAFHANNSSLDLKNIKEVIFAGYGIEGDGFSDYANANVRDKVVVVLNGEPKDKSGISLITGTEDPSDWSTDWTKKVKLAKAKGAKAILVVHNKLQSVASENRPLWFGRQTTLGAMPDFDELCNNFYLSSSSAKLLFGRSYKKVVRARKKIQKKKAFKAVPIETDLTILLDKKESKLVGDNVLGYIEGSDPALKDELLVITAHYDHLGKRGKDIYNGADDNASGTSTVLEVAQAFAEAKKAGKGSRRSVLCMMVTGEEKGLLGSKYYTQKPVFPLEKTIVNINVDMVGRVDKKYKDNPEYIYVIGSDRLSTSLHAINEGVNDRFTNLVLDYTYNAESDPNRYYYRSDHYNFAEKGIPAIFYFNGTHKDYHRTTDTMDKINFEKMAKIGQLVFHTAWEIANRDDRIQVDVYTK